MTRVALLAPALALALALVVPSVAVAEPSEPEYPPEFLALVPGWIAEAEALVEQGDREKAWFPEAEEFLGRARNASADGRLRVAMFDLETFTELLVSNQLVDASAAEGSDGERKAFIIRRTAEWRADADRAWLGFRETLHGYDAELRSLHSVEKAVYAADVALTSVATSSDYDLIAQDFPKQPGVPMGYVLALVRGSHTPTLVLGWTEDLLAEAVKQEGLPPRVLDGPYANLTAAASKVPEGEAPNYLEDLDAISLPVRENNETLMSLAVALAEQRIGRAYTMQTLFGDAGTRGLDVVNDAARGMRKQLNNTTLDTPRSYGLVGVFTSDAIDRAELTSDYVAEGNADLGTVIVAWSSLEHATYATGALAAVSPIAPPPPATTGNDAPGAGLVLVLAVVSLAAVVLRRR